MIDGFVTIIGMILVFLPLFFFIRYLLLHVKKVTLFDYHVKIVFEKKGRYGAFIAYLERILFSFCLMSFGIWMSDVFVNEIFLILFVFFTILYVIIKYLDENNTK